MITHVLDTSAILAHYLCEPGAGDVNALLAHRDPHMATIPTSLVSQQMLPPK